MRSWRTLRHTVVGLCISALAFGGVAMISTSADTGQASAQASVGGPIVIMGIDAEDGGPGSHGPTQNYADVLTSLINSATNGGSGILVIGGGKNPSDDVTTWWDEVTGLASITPTYVNGASNITSQSFAGFKIIAVVSGDGESTGGGLTAAESEALANRRADIYAFVNGGGGLMVFAQDFLDPTTSAYAFLADVGSFTFTTNLSYDLIAPTADGTAIGVTDDLDVCCWHDVYDTYPSFLKVLATDDVSSDAGFGRAAALGGVNVKLGPQPEPVIPAADPVPITPTFTG